MSALGGVRTLTYSAGGHLPSTCKACYSDAIRAMKGMAMGTLASALFESELSRHRSGSRIARAIDRWIFVFMAGWFIAIVLAGFVPDSVLR